MRQSSRWDSGGGGCGPQAPPEGTCSPSGPIETGPDAPPAATRLHRQRAAGGRLRRLHSRRPVPHQLPGDRRLLQVHVVPCTIEGHVRRSSEVVQQDELVGMTDDVVLLAGDDQGRPVERRDRKSTRLNSSHVATSYAVYCLAKNSKI